MTRFMAESSGRALPMGAGLELQYYSVQEKACILAASQEAWGYPKEGFRWLQVVVPLHKSVQT